MTFKVRRIVFTCVIVVCFAAMVGLVVAQTPARGAGPAPARGGSQTPARSAAPAAGRQASGNLLQLMRGIIYPASNVIFAAQSTDPASVKPATPDPALSTDPLSSTYGQWQAVENAGIAMAEAANLLTIPGRVCSNGRPVPLQNADWPKFVAGLRAAGMAAYKAAQSKNQDAILDAADKVSTACSDCHDVYREKSDAQGGLKGRCTK